VLLYSGVAIAQTTGPTQEEAEEQGLFYWAQKPVSCSSGDKIVEMMTEVGESPTIWMEGLVGFPNGAMTMSKFVVAINPTTTPPTWTLIEFTDGGSQGCILGHGQGNINIGQVQMQKGVGT
tara:strand:- start:615 stop:977 length:363 start_codon:yes stop_codon:yes gene_type:complete